MEFRAEKCQASNTVKNYRLYNKE